MKLSLSALALCLSLPALGMPEVVPSPVDHLFVPNGFDNNDNVEVIVTGKYPNPCYIRNTSDVEVREEKIFVTVNALRREDGEDCSPMAIPFTEAVTIGNLQAGNYEIIVNEKTESEQKENLIVDVSRSTGVDDHLYAIVDYIELGFTGGLSGDAVLMVRSPSDCVAFDRVEYISNKKDTISVLPIMKKVLENCREKVRRFEIPIRFRPQDFAHKDLLLFVRSLEGMAVYTLINK